MTILRSNVAWVMICLSIFVFLLAVSLDGTEILSIAEAAFLVNFLVIFSVLFMGVGLYLLIFNQSKRYHRRGHHFARILSRHG